jgi:hypothetical protein
MKLILLSVKKENKVGEGTRGGDTEPKIWYVSFMLGSYSGSEQCSLV